MADRLLILGGTGEAVALAKALAEQHPDLHVITSLAGVTQSPTAVSGDVRTGGFGGIEGLSSYLCDMHIQHLIDATHPFAARIAANAAAAAIETNTPRLKLLRPMWRHDAADTWIEVADAASAAGELRRIKARSVFLTLGIRDLEVFADLNDTSFVVRLIETPRDALPLTAKIVTGRGPFQVEDDLRLMVEEQIDALVTKASGGAATEGKILAARQLQLPVVMIRRPEPPAGEIVSTVDDVLAWLQRRKT